MNGATVTLAKIASMAKLCSYLQLSMVMHIFWHHDRSCTSHHITSPSPSPAHNEAMCHQNVLGIECKSQYRSPFYLIRISVKCRASPPKDVTLGSGPLSSVATKQEHDRRVFTIISVSAYFSRVVTRPQTQNFSRVPSFFRCVLKYLLCAPITLSLFIGAGGYRISCC